MKVCPVCKMTVMGDTECPICRTTLTFEPEVDAEREKYIFNKYLVIYMLKNCWFSLLCLIIVAIRFIVVSPEFHPFYLLIWAFSILAVVEGVFHRQLSTFLQWKYSEEYAKVYTYLSQYTIAFVMLVLSFIIR